METHEVPRENGLKPLAKSSLLTAKGLLNVSGDVVTKYITMISKQALQEFKAIYEKEVGPAPDEKVLVALACDLLTLMDKTYRPIKKQWVETATNNKDKKL